MFWTLRQSLSRLRTQSATIRELLALDEARLCAIRSGRSGWSPAAHLDHVIKVAHAIVARVNTPPDKPLSRGINMIGHVILAVGRIPRGRKAPEKLVGVETTRAALIAALDGLDAAIAQISLQSVGRAPAPTVPHPVFGGLSAKQALRFAGIHTDHHLRIVRELLG